MTRGTDSGPPPRHSHELAPEEFIRVKVKAELRKRLRGIRKTTPIEACAERSSRIVANVTPLLDETKSVALFWPILERHEVDLRALDPMLRARGVEISYPAIDPDTGEMTFRVSDPGSLAEAGFGFAEPPKDAPLATPAAIVVPAIAVDPTGHRIGYGAGYYDRTLPRHPGALTIAVAFDWQLVAEVPATPTDVRCAWVVTDTRVIDARR